MSITVETLQTRRNQLLSTMQKGSVAVILSGHLVAWTADQFYNFVVFRNFFYLTHIDRPNFALVMIKLSTGVQTFLFIDEVSAVEEKWSGVRMKKKEASERSGIEEKNIQGMPHLKKFLGSLIINEEIAHGYFDLQRHSYHHLDTEQVLFAKALQTHYPFIQLHNLYTVLAEMRQVKSPDEIANIRIAIEKTRTLIEAMLKVLKPGMFEYEIEAYFDFVAKLGGVQEKAFHTIVASSSNATVLHYDENKEQMKDGDLILFDLGCAWNHYSADISRTFPVNGKFTARQKAVYQAVLDVEKTIITHVKAGVKMSELNELARKLLTDKCRVLGLIGNDDKDVLKYFYHSIGHGLGLDTHDVGGREFVLKPGMVITIEPGLYIEEEALGVRIEDNILVTEKGYENLSIGIVKEIDDIEKGLV